MESRRRPDRPQALVVPALVLLGTLVATSAGAAVLSPGPLSRAHADLDSATTCFRCLGVGEHGPGDRCIDCHKEIGWLVERGRGLHGSSGQPACASCHPEHAGRELNLIPEPLIAGGRLDHARTGWPLRGKHAATRCEDCHTARFRVSEALALSARRGLRANIRQTSNLRQHRALSGTVL